MKTTTTLRAATITRTLKAAGFTASRVSNSGIRGWSNSSEGFEVTGEYDTKYAQTYVMRSGRKYWPQTSTPTGRVFVTYNGTTNINAKNDTNKINSKYNEITETLKNAGYTVTEDETYYTRRLIVSK